MFIEPLCSNRAAARRDFCNASLLSAGLKFPRKEMGEPGTDVSSPLPPPGRKYFERFQETAQKYGIEIVTEQR